MFFIGLDWAEKHLDYCIENNRGDVIKRGRVDNDDNGFNSMLSLLGKENIDLSSIAVAIESPHQHVVDFLLVRGVDVYPVNPAAIHDYRKSRKPSGSKSDSADAQLIASYLREHHKSLRVWRLPEPKLRQLMLLVDDRDKVVTEKVRLQHQLRSTLRGYFPQAVDAFCDITCPIRFACHKGMRAALGQMALASLRSNAWAKSYYSKKRNEGKKVYHALRCLANSWLKVIFAIWKNKENYDEMKHLASVARHQLSQVGA